MEAYIGFANFTMNSTESNSIKEPLDLRALYNKIEPKSLKRPENKLIKQFTINSIEVCSSSRGCTPKTKTNENKKHVNYLTVYKNGGQVIKTDKANRNNTYNSKGKYTGTYILLNIKATCRIGDELENVSLRIPRSGVIGVKVGLSSQKIIVVNKPDADHKINYLGYELAKIVYDLFPEILKNHYHKNHYKLSGLIIHGFNLFSPELGQKPPYRLLNFLDVMKEIGDRIETHNMIFEPSERKQIPRINFKPTIPGEYPSFGITNWLTVDFMGVKTMSSVRKLSRKLTAIYLKVQDKIKWNVNFGGPVQKSRRGVRQPKEIKSKNKNNGGNINIPTYDSKKRKLVNSKGKVFNCILMKKDIIEKIAKKLQVNPDGFKKDICERITKKINDM